MKINNIKPTKMNKSSFFVIPIVFLLLLLSHKVDAQDAYNYFDDGVEAITVDNEKHQFDADIKIGVIGSTDIMPFDNPADNSFVINVEDSISDCSKAYLQYDVYGDWQREVIW